MLRTGSAACLAWHHLQPGCHQQFLEKKKEKGGMWKWGGEEVSLQQSIAEVSPLVLCWSPGQIPQCLLDSYSNQLPLSSAGAPFGRDLQERASSY